MDRFILVINPGSTSTKFAIYNNEVQVLEEKLTHDIDELAKYKTIIDQLDFRKDLILSKLEEMKFDLYKLSAICGRGGLLKPIPSGTYTVNEAMLDDLKNLKYGQHASNLGALIANIIAKQLNIPSFIVDPVTVDEYEDIARISGMPMIERVSIFHALNQKAIARLVAKDQNKKYEDMKLLIVHMGGGISIGAHYQGRVIDVNSALDGDGPMTPERSGSVPIGPLTKLCFSNKYTYEELRNLNYGRGGLSAYLKTNDARVIAKRIKDGDTYAKSIFDAMIYQIAKEIGAYATVLKGKVDFIVLTGGLAHQNYLVNELTSRVNFIAPILVYPGEDELLALAQGALRVITGEEEAKNYGAVK